MNRRTAIIFYVLSTYVVIQFIWWGYHLIELTEEVSKESALIGRRVRMIIGEGSVFLLLLLIGIWQIRRSILKDLKLSERQNNFLLSVTHELKTPLAANKLYLQTLQKRELSREQAIELQQKAIEENNRLDRMINNILNASRIENNAFQLEKESFDLSKLIQNIYARVNFLTSTHPLTMQIEENIFLCADQLSIETILLNLIENAIKYSPKGSEIVIYALKNDKQVVFGVKDQGIGISSNDKKAIFQKFYRVGKEEVRTQKGTGLGLFIASELIAMNGGKIECLDNSPQGTNFKITFQND